MQLFVIYGFLGCFVVATYVAAWLLILEDMPQWRKQETRPSGPAYLPAARRHDQVSRGEVPGLDIPSQSL